MNNPFKIKTDKPNVKVSWQVSGVSKDETLNVQPVKVSAEKTLEQLPPELPRESLPVPVPRGPEPTEQSKESSPRIAPVLQKSSRQIEP